MCKFWRKLCPKLHYTKKSTNPVVVAAAKAAWPVAAARTAATAHTASPALSRSWPSPESEVAGPRGCAAPSRPAAPAAPTQPPEEPAALTPAPAHAPRPAPEPAVTPSAAPSPAAGPQSTDTSRNYSSDTCSTACVPSALSWAGGSGSVHSSAAHAAPPSWRRQARSAPHSRRACGASTGRRTPWRGPRFRPCSRRIRRARNERTRDAARGHDATACPRRRHAPPRPAPHPPRYCIYCRAPMQLCNSLNSLHVNYSIYARYLDFQEPGYVINMFMGLNSNGP